MKTKIDELTIGEVRDLIGLFGQPIMIEKNPYNIGANYFIRTVTHHYTGKLVQVGQQELVLESAAWIADDGRFADALAKCSFNEVEPYPKGNRVIIGRGSILDAVEIETLPTSQK